MAVVENLNLLLRFILELCALGALAWWGWRTQGAALAVLAPAVAAVIWALFVAPNASLGAPGFTRVVIQLAILAAAAAALAAIQRPALALALSVVAVLNALAMAALGQ